MSGTYVKNYCHLVFSTKNRENLITPEIKNKLYPYIVGIINKQNSYLHSINGMPNHVHILCDLPKNIALSKFVQVIKINSSKFINEQADCIQKFEWQKGYGSFSVSQSNLKKVDLYIQHQEQHHKNKSFKEEFLEFLEAYEIPFDHKYIWK